MAVTAEQSAPYAPQTVLIGLLDRNRDKGLPAPITPETLQRLGVSDSLVPRTMQALKVLDLIKEDGKHTEVLDRLRRAPEADYKPLMAEWLKGVYAHALDVIDPATADETSIRDAFRHYNPVSMQSRMITLFTSLFEAAGVRGPAAKATPSKKSGGAPVARARGQVKVAPKREPLRSAPAGMPSGLHPALAGLLTSLPQWWLKADRERFMTAFGAVLDLAVPIVEAAPPQEEEDADGGFGS